MAELVGIGIGIGRNWLKLEFGIVGIGIVGIGI
ncbi:unnamed protein product, partial [Rotaria sp. Silwood1]